MELSIVIPARDEADTIGNLLHDIHQTFQSYDKEVSYEIVVVDDGSTDQTAPISQKYGAKVIANDAPHGKGAALRKGFAKATGRILLMMDADYSHRAEDIPLFFEVFRDPDVGLVIGSRWAGGSDEYTPVRAFGNSLLTRILCLLILVPLGDSLNGYKAFRREIFDSYPYQATSFDIEIELIINTLRSGHRIVEIPSHERSRAGGQMKSNVIKHGTFFLYRILLEGIRYRLEKLFGKK